VQIFFRDDSAGDVLFQQFAGGDGIIGAFDLPVSGQEGIVEVTKEKVGRNPPLSSGSRSLTALSGGPSWFDRCDESPVATADG
jgi:hypothetical protein